MFDIEDIRNLEDADIELSMEAYYGSIQKAINSGYAWRFQGSYGRTMMDALEEGRCVLGKERARDYWGNAIPSRDDVLEGSKGSIEYVANRYGQEWADYIANI